MRLLKNVTVLSLLSIALIGVSSSALQAHDHDRRSGAVVIDNPTDNVIHYQFRWGNEAWSTECVQPHASMNHWYALDRHGRAPTPSIRFDNARGHNRNYSLDFFATHRPADNTGKPYEFQYSRNGSLDLVA